MHTQKWPELSEREIMPYLGGNFCYWARLTVIQMMRKMMPMENVFVWRKLEDFYNSYFFVHSDRHEEITTKSKSLPINNSLNEKSVFISLSFFRCWLLLLASKYDKAEESEIFFYDGVGWRWSWERFFIFCDLLELSRCGH